MVVRFTSTCAVAGAILSTCVTITDARGGGGNLRGEKKSVVPDDIVDLVEDLAYIDPFEGFNWDHALPLEDESSSDYSSQAHRLKGDRMTQEMERESKHSKVGGHFREEDEDFATQVESRIVGGTQVAPGDWKPWMCMTLEERNGAHYRGVCGAAMITDRWAVTAGHCISNYQKDDLAHKMDYLYVGAYQPWEQMNGESNYGKPYQKIEIAAIYEHELHGTGAAQPHDFALLKLAEPATFSGFYPLKIPNFSPSSIPLDQGCTAFGFGQTSYGGSKTEKLRKVDVGYVPRDVCDDKMTDWTITSDMMCAAAPGKDSCGGDSGGPLVMNDALVGVVSWGYKCAEEGYPGVYSSTYEHRSWMQGKMGADWNQVSFSNSPGTPIVDAGSVYESGGGANAAIIEPYTQDDINRCQDHSDKNYKVTLSNGREIKCKNAGKNGHCNTKSRSQNGKSNGNVLVKDICCRACK